MTTTFLLVFLIVSLTIILGTRRITIRQFDWWTINGIAVCLFIVGRVL